MIRGIRDHAVFAIDPGGRVTTWDDGAALLFDRDAAATLGEDFAVLFTPKDRAADVPADELRRAAATGLAEDARWHVRGDGSRFWAEGAVSVLRSDEGDISGYVKVVRDATERKLADDACREAESRFRSLADFVRDVFWITDLVERRVVYVSPAFARLWDLDPEDLYRDYRAWTRLIDPEDAPRVEAAFERVAVGGRFDETYGIRLPDGRVRRVRDRAFAAPDASGAVRRVVGVAEDVTEREDLLASEREARRQAEAASRSKDEFLAAVSHELRTPLGAVRGWTHILLQGDLDEATTRRALAAIERGTAVQVRLIEDLLDVSRTLAGKLRLETDPVDVGAVVEAAVDAVRLAAVAKRLRVELRVEPRLGRVLGDATRLQQVVWNLVSNAVKFTPEGGRVDVRVEGHESEVRITVADNGRGIDPRFVPHVFEFFRQAETERGQRGSGLGLGLAIVRLFVEAHGGSVTAASEGEGRGATFVVALPCASAPAGGP